MVTLLDFVLILAPVAVIWLAVGVLLYHEYKKDNHELL